MKKYLLSLILVLPMSVHAGVTTLSGGSDVGGGMGVVCKDSKGAIKSVELLDLWEARVVYGRTIVSSADTVPAQIGKALDQLQYALYQPEVYVGDGSPEGGVTGAPAIRQILQYDTDRFLRNPQQFRRMRGARLKKTTDSFEVVTPKDCKVEQLVRYMDTANGGFVLIDQDLLDKMDATNLAALYVHEAFYAYLRPIEKSSIRIRRAIGYVFAGKTFINFDETLSKEYYSCQGGEAGAWNEVVFFTKPDHYDPSREMITFQVMRVNGLDTIAYEAPTTYWYHWDDIFSDYGGRQISESLGSKIGFDYQFWMNVGGTMDKKYVDIRLVSAPDQKASAKPTVLECKLITKK